MCYLFKFSKTFIKTCLYYKKRTILWCVRPTNFSIGSKIPSTLVNEISFLWRPTCLTRPVIWKIRGNWALNKTSLAYTSPITSNYFKDLRQWVMEGLKIWRGGVVIGGHNLHSLFEIMLTDLPKSGTQQPPLPPDEYEFDTQSLIMVKKFANLANILFISHTYIVMGHCCRGGAGTVILVVPAPPRQQRHC